MRETEIVKGLAKAKIAMYAKGMVPHYAAGMVPEEPSIMGFIKDRAQAAMTALTPSTAPNIATDAVVQNQGLLGNAARGLRDNQNKTDAAIRDAEGYATGTPFIHGPGTGTSDSVPAMLSKGEAVLPAKTVQHIGPNNIARMIEQTNGIAPKRGLSGADSGMIGKFANGTVPYNGVVNPDVDKAITSGVPLGIAAAGMRRPAPVAAPSMVESATTGAKNLYNSTASKVGGLYDSMRNRTPTSPSPTIDPTMADAAPVAEAAPVADAAKPNFATRVAAGIPGAAGSAAVARGIAAVGGHALNATKYVLGKVATPLAVAQEVNRVGGTMLDPNKTSGQKTLSAVQGAGRFAAGAAGAATGAELGLLGGPAAPFTVPIGGMIGGVGGYFGGSKLIDGVRNSLGITDPDAGSRTLMDRAVNPNNGGAGAPTTAPTTAPAAAAAEAAAQPAAPITPMQQSTTAEAQRTPAQQAEDVGRLSGVTGTDTGIGDGNGQNVVKLTGNGLRSPLYTNVAPTQAVREYAQNAPNTVSAGSGSPALSSAGQPAAANPDVTAALSAAAGRGDFDSIKQYYEKQGQGFAGQNAATDARDNYAQQLANTAVNSSDSLGDAVLKRGQRNILQASERDALTKRSLAAQLSTASADRAERQRSGDLDRGEKGRESDLTYQSNVFNRQLQRAELMHTLGKDNVAQIDKTFDILAPTGKDGKPSGKYDRADLERKVIGTFAKHNIPKSAIAPNEVPDFLDLYDQGLDDKNPSTLQRVDNFFAQRRLKETNDVTNNRAVGLAPGAFTNSYRSAIDNQTEIPGTGFNFNPVDYDRNQLAQESIKRNALRGGR